MTVSGASHIIITFTDETLSLGLAVGLHIRPWAFSTPLGALPGLQGWITAVGPATHYTARFSPQALETRRQNRLGGFLAGTSSL
jgi:hypothetical protein